MLAICPGLVRVFGLGRKDGAYSVHTRTVQTSRSETQWRDNVGALEGSRGVTEEKRHERPYGTHSETLRNVRLNGREKRVKNS